MKLYKLDLLTLLISLFILSGCENTDTIGLDVDPATDVNGNFTDTVTVRSTTVREDSIVTNNLTQFPLGYFNDPLLGKTEANLAMTLTLVTSNTTFGTTPTLDSAVLVLHYGDEFYGDSTSKFQLDVHQLTNPLSKAKTYYNNQGYDFNSAVIGSKLVTIRRRDSVKVTEIVTSKPDVQKTKAPQIRIPINSAFINANFLNAAASNFATNAAFIKHIKGLYLTVNKAQSTGPGGVAFLNMADSSRLVLYYKSVNGTAIDTTVTTFPILSGSEPVAAQFKHDYTGTGVQTQLSNPNTQYDFTYVQGLGGLRTKIRFPYVQKLKELGNITINKAELVVTVEGGTDNFKPAPRLILYRTDIAAQRQYVPDFGLDGSVALTDRDFGGFYDASKKRYKFNVTTYVQDIIKGKLTQYDTFMAPVSENYSRQGGLTPSGTTAGRAVVGSGKNGVSYKMKLNIIYSKIN